MTVAIKVPMTIRRFSFPEIQKATDNFDETLVLGQGGFGKVYKGLVQLEDIDDSTTVVAIKRLNPTSSQGLKEFETEVDMLSKFRHCHVVSLLGYCNDSYNNHRELILVYEFMQGGTVADHLFNKNNCSEAPPPLSWVQRLRICIGAANGLNYLHTGTDLDSRVIHRDVKSSNILLNEKGAAKVSDFGLSKLTSRHQSYYVGNPKGTFGYMDPVYVWTWRLTRKSDVYSFGVVMLEMLCGRAALDLDLPKKEQRLTKWAKSFMEKETENEVQQIIDRSIVNEIEWGCLKVYVKLVNQCLHDDPKQRPTMLDVVIWLHNALSLQEVERNRENFSYGDHNICISSSGGIDYPIVAETLAYQGNFQGLQENSTTAASSTKRVVNFNSDQEGVGEGGGKRQDSSTSEYITAEMEVILDSFVTTDIVDPAETWDSATVLQQNIDGDGGLQHLNIGRVRSEPPPPQHLGPQVIFPVQGSCQGAV